MRVRDNLSGLISSQGKKRGGGGGRSSIQIGKVYGVITTPNTPTKELYEVNGGVASIGAIFYMDYNQVKYTTGIDLKKCKVALPLDANNRSYPLIGEIVHIIDGPSLKNSQISNSSTQKYYTCIINIWNNPQQNSPLGESLGKTFIESNDIRNLQPFEGDIIYQGRKGNGIRFGTTVKLYSNVNEWSSIGNDGDPITILVNGYVTPDSGSLKPNIEEINKEKSSIYMTSTQKIPLKPGASIINPRVNTIKPSNYVSSQIIANSDRITLNAKKDEVLVFAKGNIELSTDNVVNINAGRVAHINSPYINLGTKADGTYPTEPILLGNQMSYAFDILIGALSNLAESLSMATAPTTEGAIPISACNEAGTQLFADLTRLCDQLEKCLSTKVYTI
jgi:hypothetical protein